MGFLYVDFEDNEIFTPEKIATMWGFHPETVRSWCRTGKIKSHKWNGKYAISGKDFKDYINGGI
ncbi:helix-turn-helix domain-containing protein [Neobacillus sp. PS3-40]|uniref:helix-turn-helix domain-containing protein n=1 Tax=Neobacillus sp. PS3-40 TaxID=3070679 RepID=UPI0027E12033|nr:helix-turn-helix domain-containing protein [Neobacillus sp. PS3-40]WML45397.1 helix-turn-helix domain-containing protein [Neobacillus sp. PS3-40]